MRNCMISWQHLFYRYFQIFIPFQQIMITHWDVLWNLGFTIWGLIEARFWTVNWFLVADLASFLMFWFCLSFFLSFSFSFFLFFLFLPMPIVLPRICSHVPIKGGSGSYIPIRGAPIPRWDACWIVLLQMLLGTLLVFLPNLGASLPVNSLNR